MNEDKLSYLKNLTLLLIEDDLELLEKLSTILSIFFKEVLTAVILNIPGFGYMYKPME